MQERIIFLRLFCGEQPNREDIVFLEARRAFFADPQGDGGRVLRKEIQADGVNMSFQYRLSGEGRSLSGWQFAAGGGSCRSWSAARDGSYSVLTFDDKGEVAREEQYSAADGWLGVTEYRSGLLSAQAQRGGENDLLGAGRSFFGGPFCAQPEADGVPGGQLEQSGGASGGNQRVWSAAGGGIYTVRRALLLRRAAGTAGEPVRASVQAPATYVAARGRLPVRISRCRIGTGDERRRHLQWDIGLEPEENAEPMLPSAEELLSDAQLQGMAERRETPRKSQEAPPSLEELFSGQEVSRSLRQNPMWSAAFLRMKKALCFWNSAATEHRCMQAE